MKRVKFSLFIPIILFILLNACSSTKLFEASRTGNIELADKVLSKNVNLDKQNTLGETPLIVASKNGNLEVVKKFTEKGAKLEIKDKMGNTALMHALLFNHTEIADYLLENNVSLSVNNENVSPLNVAADIGSYPICNKLIEAGADITNRTITGETPIYNALFSTDNETIDLLISKSVNIVDRNNEGITTLMLAAKANRVDLLKKQLEQGMSLNELSKDGMSALHFAAMGGNHKVIAFLIKQGAKVSLKSKEGFTAIGEATRSGDIKSVQTLLNHGANINEKCEKNYTPVMISVSKSDIPMLEYLIKNNADLNVFGTDSESPLSIAVANNDDQDIIDILFDKEYQIRFSSEVDFLSLKIAVAKNDLQLINLVLDNEYNYSKAKAMLSEVNNSVVTDSIDIKYQKILQFYIVAQNELDVHKKEYNKKIAKVAGKNALRILGEVALAVTAGAVSPYPYSTPYTGGAFNFESNEFNRAMANTIKNRMELIAIKIEEIQQRNESLEN